MDTSGVWVALADEHGITQATPAAPGVSVVLTGPTLAATNYVVRVMQALRPSRIDQYPVSSSGARALVLVPTVTTAALHAAVSAGLSVLAASDHGVHGVLIDVNGAVHHIDAPALEKATSRIGRPPWGKLALVLAMLNTPAPRTQTALAAAAGMTQGRVSQAVRELTAFVAFDHGGWAIIDPAAASRWLLAHWTPPRIRSTWLTLDAPVPATRTIADVLRRAGVRWAVTGQVAADCYAPWARPTRTTLWADRLVDFSAAGCTPAPARDANVIIGVPDDPRALDETTSGDLTLADPWRVWVTLALDGDTDAADHLHNRLVSSFLTGRALRLPTVPSR